MKNLIVTILLSIIYATSLVAQNDSEPKLSKAEILQAQQLAARFYNRLAQTQDVEPLIKEFFIRDFGRWYKSVLGSDESEFKKLSVKDVRRFYTTWINYFYLHYVSVNHLKAIKKNYSDNDAEKEINNSLKVLLKSYPKLLIYAEDAPVPEKLDLGESKKLMEFRQKLSNVEQVVSKLKIIERKYRNKARKVAPQSVKKFEPKDFEVSLDGTYSQLKSSEKPKSYLAYSERFGNTFAPSFMYLVKESKRLEVIVITPPPQ